MGTQIHEVSTVAAAPLIKVTTVFSDDQIKELTGLTGGKDLTCRSVITELFRKDSKSMLDDASGVPLMVWLRVVHFVPSQLIPIQYRRAVGVPGLSEMHKAVKYRLEQIELESEKAERSQPFSQSDTQESPTSCPVTDAVRNPFAAQHDQ